MAYLKNFTKTKLLNDNFLCEFMEDIIKLNPGENCLRLFSEKKDAKSVRGKLYILLNGRKMKEDYVLQLGEGKWLWTLRVVKVAGGVTKSVDYYVRGGKNGSTDQGSVS